MIKIKYLLFALLFVFLVAAVSLTLLNIFNRNHKHVFQSNTDNRTKVQLPPPKLSGWIAWWKEQQGYETEQKFPEKIRSVSPVWFMIDKNLNLANIGSINRKKAIEDLKAKNIEILPSLGSELTGEDLSLLLNNDRRIDGLISTLIGRLNILNVDGLDIDLEGIKREDKDAFSSFLSKISIQLKKRDLKMTVTVHAQTTKAVWKGVEGQDLKRIGEIADQIRIMVYDEHSTDTTEGAIASFNWIDDVAKYNLKLIDKEKIVIGIPSYGYIWTKKGDSRGLQFDEFYNYLQGKNYSQSRDNGSGEIVFKGDNFSGWLSDQDAMTKKIERLRALGINKFIIWHLGGMDEKFFDKNW